MDSGKWIVDSEGQGITSVGAMRCIARSGGKAIANVVAGLKPACTGVEPIGSSGRFAESPAVVEVRRLRRAGRLPLLCCLLLLASCSHDLGYDRIPVPERRLNLSGLTAVSTRYLNEHPADFKKFNKMLSEADDALIAHEFLTRAGVMRWICRTAKQEGYDDQMPVYLFLRTVYLEGWEDSWFNRVDASEREYLYDLLSAIMGGMHLCTTCSTKMD